MKKFNYLLFMLLIIHSPAYAVNATAPQGFKISKHKIATVQMIEPDKADKPYSYSNRFADIQVNNKKIFVRTGGFIYEKDLPINGPDTFKLVSAFSQFNSSILHIKVIDNNLWVVKEGRSISSLNDGPRIDPIGIDSQLLYSSDNGETVNFLNLEIFKKVISSSFGNYTVYAPITRIEKININGKESLAINAGVGPSAWVTHGSGKKWFSIIDVKDFEDWGDMGYVGYFKLIDSRMFFGGEHPLDHAYLSYGDIKNGKISNLKTPLLPQNLENRRIQFIESSPFDKKVMFAGTEGGLLRSINKGMSWHFSFIETEDNKKRDLRHYPYIKKIVFPCPQYPNLIVMGGQPQHNLGTLMVSFDLGKNWHDLSDKIIGKAQFLGLEKIENGLISLVTRDVEFVDKGYSEKIDVPSLDADISTIRLNCK